MGRAARTKESRGNPSPARQNVRYIQQDRHVAAVAKHGGSILVFSDRKYVMDRKGVLHRLSPAQIAEMERRAAAARQKAAPQLP